MKITSLLASGFAALALLAVPQADAAKKLTLKGSFKFVSDAPLEKIPGTAKGATGAITFDPADLSKTTGSVSVAVSSIDTGSPSRDEHVQGESWLDGAKNPMLTFTVKSVEGSGSQDGEIYAATGKVIGEFTLRGITKPLTAKFKLKMKGARAKVELRFKVALSDYDIKGREGIIGKKVAEHIKLSGRLVGSVEDAQ